MVAFEQLPVLPAWLENILDASILTTLLYPTLYFWVFRPLTRLVDRHAQMEVELLKHHEHLEELVACHEKEDKLAAYVMSRYLNSSHADPRVEYSIRSTSNHFSGDAISVAQTPDGGLNVMMVDAMGHGLSAAINSLPAIQAFYAVSKKGIPLEALVPEINDKVRELTPPGHFLASTFLHLDANASRLTGWIGGTPKVCLHGAGDVQYFSSSNLPLGILPSSHSNFDFFSVPWSDKAMLVTCTDGVLESKGLDGNDLGENWLCEVIRKYGNSLNKTLFDKAWKESLGDNKPHDDASILIINQALNS